MPWAVPDDSQERGISDAISRLINESGSPVDMALKAAYAPLTTAATVVGPYQMLAADNTIQANATPRLDTATTTNGSAVVTDTAAASGDVGKPVYGFAGVGVPAGATVLSVVAGTSLTMSANAVAGVAGQVTVGGSFTVTLPTSPTVGKKYTVRNSGTSGLVTVADGSGAVYAVLTPGDAADLVSDGTIWRNA